MKDLRIAFFGTPQHAVYVLDELKKERIVPTLVVTAPDRPAGRKLVLTPPPVKDWALQNDVEVLQLEKLAPDAEGIELLENSEWDVFIVAAYNIFLPKRLLTLPAHGVLNVHPSLLPKLRGPSPVRTAIAEDLEDAVGVTVIELDEDMDHGPIVAQATVELPEWPVRGDVLDEILFREGGRLLVEVLPEWVRGAITPDPQNHAEATFTKRIEKKDGEITLTDDARKNYLKFCAHDGWPGTFFFADCNNKTTRLKVREVSYVDDVFTVERVIPEGKKEMSFEDWKRGCSA